MKITIDNHDGAGARDYTSALDLTQPAKVHRSLNKPSRWECVLAGVAAFVTPVKGARVRVTRNDGLVLFTGYVSAATRFEHLGEGGQGPAYRWMVNALSDEWLLDARAFPDMPSFINRTAGDVLSRVTKAIAGNDFDLSGVEALDPILRFHPSVTTRWSDAAALIADQSHAAYRVLDGGVQLRPIGSVTHVLDESSERFEPQCLALQQSGSIANDVAVSGNVEADARVKDYFLGDGFSYSFNLSQQVYDHRQFIICDEEFRGAGLDANKWSVT